MTFSQPLQLRLARSLRINCIARFFRSCQANSAQSKLLSGLLCFVANKVRWLQTSQKWDIRNSWRTSKKSAASWGTTRICSERILFGEDPLRTSSDLASLIRSSRPQAAGNQRPFNVISIRRRFYRSISGLSKLWRPREKKFEHHSHWYCWGYWQVIRQNHSTSTAHQSIDTRSKTLSQQYPSEKIIGVGWIHQT